MELSESQIKAQIKEIVGTQTALSKAIALKNPAQRARALRPFLQSKNGSAQNLAFSELAKCGKAVLPVLRPMLHDKTLLPLHGYIVDAMGKAGGISVEGELIELVVVETKFWKQTAPQLKVGWWQGAGISRSEVYDLRNRYSKLHFALRALEPMKSAKSKVSVIQLRDFWRSLTQLEDKSGLNQMSEECDEVLKRLAAKR